MGEWSLTEWKEFNRPEVVRFELEYSNQHWSYPDKSEPVLVKARPRWRITAPELMPHVSVPWAVRRLQNEIEREKNPGTKEKELAILRRLKALDRSRAGAL
jgi:hypothetical protein